ncbi:hypothetical protein BYT27DRAFT_7088953, partial [Phlegmacium glaucopus]
YQPDLTPSSSELRPHCSACDRLRLWVPTFSRSGRRPGDACLEITDADLDRVITVINTSWQPTTRETYGTGLLIFHVFCDQRGVPELLHCPADSLLMLTFISSCAGSYSGKTLANYFYTIHTWHTLHGAPWSMNSAKMKAALDGATILAPPASKRPKWLPLVLSVIIVIAGKLNHSKPLDAAVYACLTTMFYLAAQLGELTVTSLKAFDLALHVKVSDVCHDKDRHGFQVTVFHLPRTKTTPTGEDVYWAAQEGPSDPHAALVNHYSVNSPPLGSPLFAWRHPQGIQPLTQGEFLKLINAAAARLGIPSLKGHGIRIHQEK